MVLSPGISFWNWDRRFARRVRSLLKQGADYQIGFQEKTPLAKTVRTCRQLLKVEPEKVAVRHSGGLGAD